MEKRKEFNQKAWYRLLKVAFVTIFILVYGIYATIILADAKWKELDQDNIKVTCNENWKTEGYAEPITFELSEVNVEITEGFFNDGAFDYKSFLSTASQDYYYHSYDLFKIFSKCFPDREEGFSSMSSIHLVQRIFELTQQGLSAEEARAIAVPAYLESFENVGYYGANELLFNYHIFEVEPNYKYISFVWPIALGLLATLLTFEIIRRLFYYIAFGSFLLSDYSKVYTKLRSYFR